jgi:protein-S-isoprenylcysteine O-methyltransferase Ste14
MSEPRHKSAHPTRHGERTYWLDDPANVNRLVYAFYGLCALALVIDPLVPKHGPFSIEHYWGFYGLFGFVACVALVLIAKELRKLLMRAEDYYDR